jgi:hypothetical protein
MHPCHCHFLQPQGRALCMHIAGSWFFSECENEACRCCLNRSGWRRTRRQAWCCLTRPRWRLRPPSRMRPPITSGSTPTPSDRTTTARMLAPGACSCPPLRACNPRLACIILQSAKALHVHTLHSLHAEGVGSFAMTGRACV